MEVGSVKRDKFHDTHRSDTFSGGDRIRSLKWDAAWCSQCETLVTPLSNHFRGLQANDLSLSARRPIIYNFTLFFSFEGGKIQLFHGSLIRSDGSSPIIENFHFFPWFFTLSVADSWKSFVAPIIRNYVNGQKSGVSLESRNDFFLNKCF